MYAVGNYKGRTNMNYLSENKVNVFISYSWDSAEHKEWVLSIADLINENGGHSIVDRTHLKFGGHIKTFMLKSILQADVVLMMLTPEYRKKADNLEGGAGFEYNIINDELFKIIKQNDKYIPIIREGSLETSVTSFLQGFNCADLRIGEKYEENLNKLMSQTILIIGSRIVYRKSKPMASPAFLNRIAMNIAKLRKTKSSIKYTSRNSILVVARLILNSFV